MTPHDVQVSKINWLHQLIDASAEDMIDHVKIFKQAIRQNENLAGLYDHLAVLKQIGLFLHGDVFLQKYLSVHGLDEQKESIPLHQHP